MKSLAYIPGSNGTANASLMTVQTLRSPGATTIAVNTVLGAPTKFYGSMGTPHTFTDPVTSEVVTVISEATAVDFAGSISGSVVNIDAIAPGYLDTRGSAVGDIIVIRPITEWANNIFNLLGQSHNDDGSLKFTPANDPINRALETQFDFIASGCVWSLISGFNGAMSAGVIYIDGVRVAVSAIASKTYTASKDTYISVGVDGVVDYTEAISNTASPALAASHIRLGVIVTNGSGLSFINQGQENATSPTITGTELMQVTDSLGNLICPRDPNRKVLGYRQITVAQTVAGAIVGLKVPVIVPVGRKVRVTASASTITNSVQYNGISMAINDFNTGLQIQNQSGNNPTGSGGLPFNLSQLVTPPAAGARSYNALAGGSGTITVQASSSSPAYILVELA